MDTDAVDLADPERAEAWKRGLARLVEGRKVICALSPLAAFTAWVELLHRYGAQKPLVIANGRGTGPVPAEHQALVCQVTTPPTTLQSEEVRQFDGFLRRHLPTHARSAIEEYDPEAEAIWLTGAFTDDAPLLGRRVAGGRPRAWAALEDKTTIDALWTRLGVPTAPSRTVPVDRTALEAAHAELSASAPGTGDGWVWAGDARDGVNGAGEYVRWVVTDHERAEALEFFRGRCDRVRVMPFLEGVPCSIHGCVIDGGVAVFSPLELAVLRRPDRSFVYGGLGSSWSPPPEDVDQMRDLARRTGLELADLVGYRGFFGIDGVLTTDGFRPTELNPRFTAGASAIADVVDRDAFLLLQFALTAGEDAGVAPAALERWVLDEMRRHRFVKAVAVGPWELVGEPVDRPVGWDGRSLVDVPESMGPTGPSQETVEGTWTLRVGPTPVGIRAHLIVPRPPPGVRAGELNAALMRLLDAELGTAFGEVHPAPDVRRVSRSELRE